MSLATPLGVDLTHVPCGGVGTSKKIIRLNDKMCGLRWSCSFDFLA